jgi:anti-sigma factor RsiW
MVSNEHCCDFLPAHALRCLDQEELAAAEAHLAACADCRAELEEFLALVERLSLCCDERAPSEELKARLLQRVRQERQAGASAPANSGHHSLDV